MPRFRCYVTGRVTKHLGTVEADNAEAAHLVAADTHHRLVSRGFRYPLPFDFWGAEFRAVPEDDTNGEGQ